MYEGEHPSQQHLQLRLYTLQTAPSWSVLGPKAPGTESVAQVG